MDGVCVRNFYDLTKAVELWYNSIDKGVTDGDLWTSLSQKKNRP